MSTAILTLSENGDLQRIHDKWLTRAGCSSRDKAIDANRLSLESFWGLFLICGLSCVIALLVFFMRIFCQYNKYNSTDESRTSSHPQASDRRPSRLASFKDLMSFVDKKEEEIKIAMKRKVNDKQLQFGQCSDESPA